MRNETSIKLLSVLKEIVAGVELNCGDASLEPELMNEAQKAIAEAEPNISGSIGTVNVIEFDGDQIIELVSFQDDKNGNDQAEALFKESLEAKHADPDLSADAVENGVFNIGEWRIVIFHSTLNWGKTEPEPEAPRGGCHICGHDH